MNVRKEGRMLSEEITCIYGVTLIISCPVPDSVVKSQRYVIAWPEKLGTDQMAYGG